MGRCIRYESRRKKRCRMKSIRTLLKNIVLYYVNKGAAAPFSIVHYDFF